MYRNLIIIASLALLAATLPAQEKPPVVTYGGERTSSEWIETAGGKIAVDKGAEWQGVKVYLSMLWDLIAVDPASKKVLWSMSVGAFWNEFTFKEVETQPGKKTWLVELRPGPGTTQGKEERQYHDLRSGKVVALKGKEDIGKSVKLAASLAGDDAASEKKLYTVIDNASDFENFIVQRYFAGRKDAPDFKAIDFKKHLVVAVFYGDGWNCDGIGAKVYDDGKRFLVRLEEKYYQTFGEDGGGVQVRPWGIIVFDRPEKFRPIVVERNQQNLIGGPALWKEIARFDEIPQPPDRGPKDLK